MSAPLQASLDMAMVGNGSFAALVDAHARVVWGCVPAFDGDPAFCALLSPTREGGDFAIELEGFVRAEQQYIQNTAILRTVLHDANGGAVEITDFAPRWRQHERFYHPVMLVRSLRALSGTPRIRVRLRPLGGWGAQEAETTSGSNHVRYVLPGHVLRATSDIPVRLLRDGLPFVLDRDLHIVLGPDESLQTGVAAFAGMAPPPRGRDTGRGDAGFEAETDRDRVALLRGVLAAVFEDVGRLANALGDALERAAGAELGAEAARDLLELVDERLGIEGVEVARPALHEKENDVLRTARAPGQRRARAREPARRREHRRLGERRERDRAKTAAGGAEEITAGGNGSVVVAGHGE